MPPERDRDGDRENMWRCINELQKGQATMAQASMDIAKNVDRLTSKVEANMLREAEDRQVQAVKLAQVEAAAKAAAGDAKTANDRVTAHKEDHKWLWGQVLAVVVIIIGAVEAVLAWFKK